MQGNQTPKQRQGRPSPTGEPRRPPAPTTAGRSKPAGRAELEPAGPPAAVRAPSRTLVYRHTVIRRTRRPAAAPATQTTAVNTATVPAAPVDAAATAGAAPATTAQVPASAAPPAAARTLAARRGPEWFVALLDFYERQLAVATTPMARAGLVIVYTFATMLILTPVLGSAVVAAYLILPKMQPSTLIIAGGTAALISGVHTTRYLISHRQPTPEPQGGEQSNGPAN